MRLGRLMATVALVFIAGAALAEVKWDQYPDPAGNAWLSQLDSCPNGWTYEMADDFECLDGDPITAVEWWGTSGGMANLPDHYLIRFYGDVPAGTGGIAWSRPGDLLYEEECWDFTAVWDGGLNQFRFSQDLAVPFCQELGTIYWFSVVGVVCTEDPHLEGAAWCACFAVDQWNDLAVIRSDLAGYPEWTAMSDYYGGYNIDLSFVLHGGPPFTPNVVCDPDPLEINVVNNPGQIAVEYLGGGGGAVYGYSVKFTWNSTYATTAVGNVSEGTLLSGAGPTVFQRYSSGTDEITVDCTLLGAVSGVTGPGTMFTIDFTGEAFGTSPVNITLIAFRDNANNSLCAFYEDDGEIQVDITNPSVTNVEIENLTLGHTDEYAKNTDNLELTATITDDYTLSASDIKADLSTLLDGGDSAEPAQSYVSPTATWTLPLANVTLTADGLKTVTVTATDGLGNSGSDTDDITADNTPPGNVTGFASAPAHEEGILSWTDPTSPSLDTNYYGIVVRYAAWGDYPYYDTGAPAYPPTHTGGDGEAFSGLGAVTGAVHTIVPRDIHYYSAFACDWALNYGGVDAGGQDRCTNYWLGDIAAGWATWGYNGLVDDADFDKLAGTYPASTPVIPEAECDVGPTDDHSRVGIPVPDDSIGFEDLMIFSMNYGVVAPRVVPFLPDEATKALSLELAELGATGDGMFEVALRLEGNASEVKGLSTVIAYGSSDLEFVSARLSDDMSSPLAPVFFWHGADGSSVQIDLAVLGTDVTVGGSGKVAVLTFRALSEEYALEFSSADLRGASNEHLSAELEGHESKPEVPMAFRLVGNTPNPFNPVTKIAFAVPHEAQVSVRVYDVTGRLVRTLVDGRVEPGVHEVAWDGRSNRGESVGSGVYFCTMEAADFHGSHKLMLLK